MADRPLECSHCKKAVKVVYKEIAGGSIITTEMCADCPILEHRLHGTPFASKKEGLAEGEAGLCCGKCLTAMETIKMGNPLGCSECYNVFSEILISELAAGNKISPRLQKAIGMKKNQPIHVGKSPNKSADIPSSSRLTAMNEALNEAVKKENYEQAAWLRDQIKALTEKSSEGKN